MNGLLVVDKPAGCTSHDVVARVRKMTGESSIGHLGTLDPMATGVLPLLLGSFTRLARFFKQDEKRYTGTIRFGVVTDTYDADGDAVGPEIQPELNLKQLRTMAAEFLGSIEQTPPPFSAKKLKGVPAYALARKGKPVELRAVKIVVHKFVIVDYAAPDAAFDLEISSGGYVRSIAHELGKRAGCGAHLSHLCRVRAGEFAQNEAATLDEIAEWARAGSLVEHMPHPRELLHQLPAVTVDMGTAANIRHGMACNLPEYSAAPLVRIFTDQRELIAIGRRLAGTLIHPMVVLS